MKKLKSYMHNYSRAVLTDVGVMIKDQQSFSTDAVKDNAVDDSGPVTDPFVDQEEDEAAAARTSYDGASFISCVTCLSDNDSEDQGNGGRSLPANTLIPYVKILYARKVCAVTTELSHYRDEVNQSNDGDADTLGAEFLSTLIEVTIAKPRRHDLVPKKLLLCFGTTLSEEDIVETLMQRSYKGTKRGKSILVLVNPHGGKGQAKKLFVSKVKPILTASNCMVDTLETTHRGHAMEIAQTVNIDKYDIIACASGDGIPHEVLNGLFRREDRAAAFNKLAITQLPCGSGNAMSLSCHGTTNPTYAALSVVKAPEIRIDLMCCTQESYKDHPKVSFLSQTYGVIAESDINTECIRWMGPSRFELGVLLNILQRKKYPCELYVKYLAKSKNELREYYNFHKKKQEQANNDSSSDFSESLDVEESDFTLKYDLLSDIPEDWDIVDSSVTGNLGIFYAGKMPYVAPNTKFFPAALPNDGAVDLVLTDSRTSLTRMAPILLSLDKGYHVLQPEVIHSKVTAYRLIPKVKNSIISIDGEMFPFEPLQVEVLSGLCKTLSYNGSYVETDFESM
ncbi:LANO_0A06062g1_1 [Lachancea nothofagi CBS 11611]|uniref:sphingosine kinase n=1 Tax=Lachancea nothofagi CBS 11611 TaxID=1266666 RepID=A0A1G4IRU3_9SACH|nr:LANO_0A06062g1_1 [Lachancea nothofagi CBS 11611]